VTEPTFVGLWGRTLKGMRGDKSKKKSSPLSNVIHLVNWNVCLYFFFFFDGQFEIVQPRGKSRKLTFQNKQGREEKKKKKKMTDYAILGVDYITRSSTTPGSPLLVFFHFFIIA